MNLAIASASLLAAFIRQTSLSNVTAACVLVTRRVMRVGNVILQSKKGNFAEISPQKAVERIRQVSALSPMGCFVFAL